MIKLVTVTWAYDDNVEKIKDTFLYKSFIKHNDEKNFIHFHYNRNNYKKEEENFKNRFGYQYEFLLYKIHLMKDRLNEIECEYYIFSDAFDVVCMGDINTITPTVPILFSSEANRYPSSYSDWGGIDYDKEHYNKKHFLNAGLFLIKKDTAVKFYKTVIGEVMLKNLKSFGGDQGVFTFHYMSRLTPEIIIDKENKLFFSSFDRYYKDYVDYQFPMFVHDNGWDWGSHRFIYKFNLNERD